MTSARLQTYEAPGITVTFDPNICIHSGVCVRGLRAVFDVRRKRWIRPEAASPDEVAAQVSRCPSGALQYRRTAAEPEPFDPADQPARTDSPTEDA